MKPSEDRLIAKVTNLARIWHRRNSALRLSIGDDAALLRPEAGHEIVLTCDWFLEGSHFLRRVHPPAPLSPRPFISLSHYLPVSLSLLLLHSSSSLVRPLEVPCART